MSEALPGLHHCIGTARTVTDIVFRSLRAQCAAGGGTLSVDEINKLHSTIIDSFASGYDLFELRHRRFMGASLSLAAMPFARDKILATMLLACGGQCAQHVFALQVEHLGDMWISQFFDGFAQYVDRYVCTNAHARLTDAYVETALTPKIVVSVYELLKREAVRSVLGDCLTSFETPGAPEEMAKQFCDSINDYTASRYRVAGPHVTKITEDQATRFLKLFPHQATMVLETAQAPREAEATPIFGFVPAGTDAS
jgi:hypothetical protein